MSSRKSILLEEMVWPEIESALENGKRTVIVPVGSIEQHGPTCRRCFVKREK